MHSLACLVAMLSQAIDYVEAAEVEVENVEVEVEAGQTTLSFSVPTLNTD